MFENMIYLSGHSLPNGRKIDVIPLTYGRARICLITVGCEMSYDDSW